jgi:peptide/nickel transport system substrate-binding protein
MGASRQVGTPEACERRAMSYWERASKSRLSRRSAIGGGLALGAGAAALAIGCGGGSDSSDGGDASGLFAERKDTTKDAVRGGVYQSLRTADIPSLDPTSSVSFLTQVHSGYVYSRLLQFRPGVLKPASGEIDGDLAESWEVLDGGSRIVLKIRGDAGLDARPPTSGRKADANDVTYSWSKFSTLHPQRTDIARSASPSAPVESLEAPDARTVVVRLAEPFSVILPLLASTQHLWVIPREAETAFDARNESRGSGPWFLDSYQRSVGMEYRRNTNWYKKPDHPRVRGPGSAVPGQEHLERRPPPGRRDADQERHPGA